MRALRPDRMTYAVQGFVEEKLGGKYVESRSVEFAKSFEESGPSTPVFFILSPGANPLKVKFISLLIKRGNIFERFVCCFLRLLDHNSGGFF